MSHFTVLVVGPNFERQLQPFHEYECTGIDDEFIVDVDETETARAEYETDTLTRLRDSAGVLHSYFDDEGNFKPEFSKIDTDIGSRRVRFIPEGFEEVEVPAKDLKTFAQWAEDYYSRKILVEGQARGEEHKYGYVLINAAGDVIKVVNRTNPNPKWDWYQVGGRWSGSLRLKDDYVESLKQLHSLFNRGKPIPDSLLERIQNIGTGDRSWMNRGDPQDIQFVDFAPKKAIDFEGMREEGGKKAAEHYDTVMAAIAGRDWITWDEVRAKHPDNIDAARAEYNEQPVIKDARSLLGWFDRVDTFKTVTREQYIKRGRENAVSFFALLKDGQWYERGSMGWWGMVADEEDADTWNQKFQEMLDGLPDDTLLTVVDCHI